MPEPFAEMLAGGHPNSLGRTVEVVEAVLADPLRMRELVACYDNGDPVVRLRTSNALKRIEAVDGGLVASYLPRILAKAIHIDQPSVHWTLAQLFRRQNLTDHRWRRIEGTALELLKRNLTRYDDWIVLTQTIATLEVWAQDDAELRRWLRPQLERLAHDPRKSVATKATRALKTLG